MSVVSALEVELEAMGLVDTVEGQTALVLARNLDGGRNGMAKQGDAARLREVMTWLRGQVVREADSYDEVRRRREANIQRAAAG